MKTLIRVALALAFVLPCNVRAHGAAPDAGNLVAWNARLLATAEAEDRFLTLKGVRTAAMMHLAVHDAVNAIDPRFPVVCLRWGRPRSGSAGGGDAGGLRHRQRPVPGAARSMGAAATPRYEARATTAKSRDAGIVLGEAAAQAVLAKRANDRWDSTAAYKFHPMAPGVYAEFSEHSGTPQGFVFGAGWAVVEPFALKSPAQFRSPPPPAINSVEYTRAFDEVRTVGRFESRKRTADQTHLAFWWKEFAEASHNRLARQLVLDEEPDLWKSARLFALLNVSIMDGYIGVFDNKFFYNHWRPYTAIRWADHDGNPRTRAEPDWNNTHRHTYAFPSYPSAHGTACAAAMTVFADTFGDHRWFRMVTPEVDAAGPLSEKISMKPATRSFDSFSEAARECAWSRVYLGIHFRYDSIEGNRLGQRIGALRGAHLAAAVVKRRRTAILRVLTLLMAASAANAQPWERAVFQDVTLEYRAGGRRRSGGVHSWRTLRRRSASHCRARRSSWQIIAYSRGVGWATDTAVLHPATPPSRARPRSSCDSCSVRPGTRADRRPFIGRTDRAAVRA